MEDNIKKFDDYSIEGLAKEFESHEIKNQKEYPDYAAQFCISKALKVMSKEIAGIKYIIGIKNEKDASQS